MDPLLFCEVMSEEMKQCGGKLGHQRNGIFEESYLFALFYLDSFR